MVVFELMVMFKVDWEWWMLFGVYFVEFCKCLMIVVFVFVLGMVVVFLVIDFVISFIIKLINDIVE